jgi:hypothetical protein
VRPLLDRYDTNIDAIDHLGKTALELAECTADPVTIELLLARIDQWENPANYRTKHDWDRIRKWILRRALRYPDVGGEKQKRIVELLQSRC